jgi:hypothetical protein
VVGLLLLLVLLLLLLLLLLLAALLLAVSLCEGTGLVRVYPLALPHGLSVWSNTESTNSSMGPTIKGTLSGVGEVWWWV